MIRVRQATIDDAPAMARIHVTGWQTAYRGIISDAVLDTLRVEDRVRFWTRHLPGRTTRTRVAVDDHGDVVGFADFARCRDADASDAAELLALYVEPTRLRHGAGRALWEAMRDELVVDGFPRVGLWVLRDSGPSRRFYEAMGATLDAGSEKTFAPDGASVAEVRYWRAL